MTFFYDLNKKLDAIREQPELKHGQLNERDEGKPGKNFAKIAKDAGERYGSKAAGERVAGAVRNKLKAQGKLEEGAAAGYDPQTQARIKAATPQQLAQMAQEFAGGPAQYQSELKMLQQAQAELSGQMEEGLGNMAKKVGGIAKKVGGAVLNKLGHGSDEDMIRDLQKKAGVPQTGKKPEPAKEGVDKQAFAALAPPKDKITFADKIAGAKKEVDEMLGDVAAEAIKGALTAKQKKLDKNNNGKIDGQDLAMLRKGKGKEETDEGWDDMMKDVERRRSARKVGDVTHGAKHDTEEIPGGRRVTRRVDPNTGYSVGADDDSESSGEKRGRGRPKGSKKAVGAKGPSGKSKLMTKEGGTDQNELKAAAALLKKAGYKITKGDREEVDEKAVSKKQQRFMGMVHATQKGEKAPSKEVAKVAKTMKKKDAEDFASTKHKGLPEKKKPEAKKSDAPKKDSKPEGKKKEKTEEQGGTGTPTASSGFSFGKGIYDSMNRELETMIAESMSRLDESMSINMSDSTEGGKSLTITASDDDAMKLAEILKMAGVGGVSGEESPAGEIEVHAEPDGDETCDTCGSADCGCGDVHEALDENNPDWPTDEVETDDALQYAGGLNGPKSTGQSVGAPFNRQDARQGVMSEDSELARIKEIAGIKEEKKSPKADKDYDKDGKIESEKDEVIGSRRNAAGLDEGILAATANLWKTYRG